uniref:SGNH hydrolase-type esterase domain-containing protein n=1 Tax=Anser brachyrhynchus TaxID=132585 RepID=A0A8B9C455_9AVES
MVGTRCSGRSEAATQTEEMVPLWAHVGTQMDPLRGEVAVQTGDCGELRNLETHLGPEGGEGCHGCRCALLKELLKQVAGLQRESSSLRGSWESLRVTDRRCQPAPADAQQPPPKSLQGVVADPADHMQDRGLDCPQEKRGWTLISARSRKRHLLPTPTVPPTPTVSLGNRFEALRQEKEEVEGLDSSPNPGSNPEKRVNIGRSTQHRDRGRMGHCIKTSATIKGQRVLVTGDSLFGGTEAPVCSPDNLSREVCCLPGAHVRDVRNALPQLIKPEDYYPLVVIQVGSREAATRKMSNIKKDFASLGRMLKGSGVQVVFSSVLPLGGWDPERRRRMGQVNDWLRGWCPDQGFGYFNLGQSFEKPGMWADDQLQLSKWGT